MINNHINYRRFVIAAFVFVLALSCISAFASTSVTINQDSVPWNSALGGLISALSGRTALYISMVGLFFAGGILIFGGDLGTFGRMVMMVILVGSTLTGLNAFITTFLSEGALLL